MALLEVRNLLALGASLAVIAISTLVLFWKRTVLKLRLEKQLQVRVLRDLDPAMLARRRAELQGGLVSLLDLDDSVTSSSASLCGLHLLPLGDYFASLRPMGVVSWERAIISVADRFGLAAAMPLALFLPNRWRSEAAAGGLLRCFPSLNATLAVTITLSTLDLFAFAETVHIFAAARRSQLAKGSAAGAAAAAGKQQGKAKEQQGQGQDAAQRAAQHAQQAHASQPPLAILRAGCRVKAGDPPLRPLPSPLVLAQRSLHSMLGLSEAARASDALLPAPAPRPLSPLLPDLYLGNGGLTLTKSAEGAAMCGLMARVLNRLAANALDGMGPTAAGLLRRGAQQQQQQAALGGGNRAHPPSLASVGAAAATAAKGAGDAPFLVRLEEGGPLLGTVEGLLGALREAGHSVQLRLSSNLTSFGMGLSVRSAEGGWQQIPLAYPLRCSGLWACDENGKQMDVWTLMPHAAVVLCVHGPLLNFELEWCLSIEGFTGWLPYVSVARDWASGEEFRATHPLGDQPDSPDQQCRLARLLTAATCVINVAAQRDGLLFGGYGHVGVCVDSVAAIQQAVLGRCTLFPLVLGGEAKLGLMALYRDVQKHGWEYGEEAAALQGALAALPCDAIQGPRSAAYAARRALACLPTRSPFAAMGVCRKGLEAALAAATELCPEE